MAPVAVWSLSSWAGVEVVGERAHTATLRAIVGDDHRPASHEHGRAPPTARFQAWISRREEGVPRRAVRGSRGSWATEWTATDSSGTRQLRRQQIHTVNENVYRFLAIYQTIATALVAAAIALFVNYKTWNVAPETARTGLVALLLLVTAVATFTVVMIVIGALSWLDYRKEECELADKYFMAGFRAAPKPGNLWRWYETYIVLFVIIVTVGLWLLAGLALLPRVT